MFAQLPRNKSSYMDSEGSQEKDLGELIERNVKQDPTKLENI